MALIVALVAPLLSCRADHPGASSSATRTGGPFLAAGAAVVAYLLVGTYVLPWYLAWGLPVLAVVWRWRIGWLVLLQVAVLQLATARPPSATVADPLSVGSPLGRFQLDLYTVGAPLLEVALVVIVIAGLVWRQRSGSVASTSPALPQAEGAG